MDHAKHCDVLPERQGSQVKVSRRIFLIDANLIQEAAQNAIEWRKSCRGGMVKSSGAIFNERQHMRFEEQQKVTVAVKTLSAQN